MGSSATRKLGLLAGVGRLPLLVAESARGQGYQVHAFGFKGMMAPGLPEVVAGYQEFPFCQAAALFSAIENQGIQEAVTIGSIAQTSVLGGMPQFDDLALELWRRLPDRRVDTIMAVLVEELARRGVRVEEVVKFLESHLAPAGELTERKPSEKEWSDVRFGFRMAKAVGGLDVGQTVVVKHRAVMAVEAVEGTDLAIRRGAELARGGAVVVKVAKPGQDLRYDVPAVGKETLETMRQAGARVLAVEAGMVLLVEREAMITWADEAGLCMVGLSAEEAGLDG